MENDKETHPGMVFERSRETTIPQGMPKFFKEFIIQAMADN